MKLTKEELQLKLGIWHKAGSQDMKDIVETYLDLEEHYNKLKIALLAITKYDCQCPPGQECCGGSRMIYIAENALKEGSK